MFGRANRSFATLLPRTIGYRDLQFDPDVAGTFDAVARTIELPSALQRAIPKRQREFLAGRLCAREAMRSISPGHSLETVGIGTNREPVWPRALVGSVTHSGGFAAAAVARRADHRSIGIDGEALISDAVAASVTSTIARANEIDKLALATGMDRTTILTLVFSAKESLFKCLFPLVGRYFDFADAELRTIDRASDAFVVELVTTLAPDFPAGRQYDGRFSLDGAGVMTGIFLAGDGDSC
jgi:enterobactin synthetase component D